MSNTIITKRCSKCKTFKPLSEFYTDRHHKDGKTWWCKVCVNISTNRYKKTEKGQQINRYCSRRYAQTEDGKRNRVTVFARYMKNNPQKIRTRANVRSAVYRGRLKPALHYHCRICWSQAEEYHHHRGYEPEHTFDLIPLCKICHVSIHKATA